MKLLPEAIALLDKYKDELRETLLPVQDYRVLRANMKSLRVLAGIKPISSIMSDAIVSQA